MENVINILIRYATTYGISILGAVIILIVGKVVANWTRRVIRKTLSSREVDPAIVSFIGSLSYFLVLTFAVLAALKKFGIETASLVAVLGAAGFAIGFALQGSLSNFAAGVMLLVFRPFKIGDFVEAGGASGTVKDMGLFTTIMMTPDNIRIIVPNGKIFGDTIKNITAEDTRRIDLIIGIGYGSSISQAISVIKETVRKDERILEDPPVQIAVSELADSSVNFVIRPWVRTSDYWAVKFDLTRNIKEAFDGNNIEIPFPQVVVHKG